MPQNHEETAPFPDELPYRLVRMFSCLGDTVLDPFVGTGTTVRVATLLGRKGIGYEVNPSLRRLIEQSIQYSPPKPEDVIGNLLRIYEHSEGAPNLLVSSRARNLKDRSLSSFR